MTSPDATLAALYTEHLAVIGARFADALEATGHERAVIFAGELHLRPRDDSPYPFKVDPYFAWWLPLANAPGSVVCFEPGRKPRLIFRQDDDFWHVPPADPDPFWAAHFDIEVSRSARETSKLLRPWQRACAVLGSGAVTNGAFEPRNPTAVLARLDFERARKTAYEVACLAEANRIAAGGHRAAATAFAEGLAECEIDEAYRQATAQRESELPYSNIVALNEHAAILHYQLLERTPPVQARSFLIDAGATFHGYASDVTRTWQRGQPRFAALIDALETLQQTVCGEVAAGLDYVELNEQAHVLLAAVLAEQGIVHCCPEEAHASGLTRTFLPHGLGHLLGLQVHDVGGWQAGPDGTERRPPSAHPFLRLTRTLEPGFAFTIEPGVYFIPTLLNKLDAGQRNKIDWSVVETLLPCGGIRIEDDLVVESTHVRNLTREAFASLDVA